MAAIERYLDELAAVARDGLAGVSTGSGYSAPRGRRTSTISFTVQRRRRPPTWRRACNRDGVNVWDGDNYAYELMQPIRARRQRRRGPRQPRALQRPLRRAAAGRRGRAGGRMTARVPDQRDRAGRRRARAAARAGGRAAARVPGARVLLAPPGRAAGRRRLPGAGRPTCAGSATPTLPTPPSSTRSMCSPPTCSDCSIMRRASAAR